MDGQYALPYQNTEKRQNRDEPHCSRLQYETDDQNDGRPGATWGSRDRATKSAAKQALDNAS